MRNLILRPLSPVRDQPLIEATCAHLIALGYRRIDTPQTSDVQPWCCTLDFFACGTEKELQAIARQHAAKVVYFALDLRQAAVDIAEEAIRRGPPRLLPGYGMPETLEMLVWYNLPLLVESLWRAEPEENVLLLVTEEIAAAPQRALMAIVRHLGLPSPTEALPSLAPVEGSAEVVPPHEPKEFLSVPGLSTLFNATLGRVQTRLGYPLATVSSTLPADRGLSFFTSKRQPYYISAPDFKHNSAGIRCLHYLCHVLNELGEEAYLTPAQAFNPSLRTPPLTLDIVRRHFLTGRQPIALYPEVIAGNPLALPVVARWLLNRPGHLSGDTRHGQDDLIFHFAHWCRPDGVVSDLLNLPTVDSHVFNNLDNPDDHHRQGACYYANKYLGHGGEVPREIREQAISLGQEIPRAPQELAAILRRSAVLYCFELSSLIQEALSCGCPVLIMPTPYWAAHGDPTVFLVKGIKQADTPDALRIATQEVASYQYATGETMHYYWWQVQRFINRTQAAVARPQAESLAENLWCLPTPQRASRLAELEQQFNILLPTTAASAESRYRQIESPAEVAMLARLNAAEATLPQIDLYILANHVNGTLAEQTLATLPDPLPSCLRVHVVAPAGLATQVNATRIVWHAVSNLEKEFNALVAASDAQWCILCHAGDRLVSMALDTLLSRILSEPTRLAFTSDEDSLDIDGQPGRPILHCAMDGDLLRAGRSAFGLLTVRREAWMIAGGWRPQVPGLDHYDFGLRLLEICHESGFGHIPRILVSRHRNNIALLPDAPDVQVQRRLLLAAHLQRSRIAGQAEPGMVPDAVNVRYPVQGAPTVSLLLPTRDNPERLANFIGSLLNKTSWPHWELLIVDNSSEISLAPDPTALAKRLSPHRVAVIPYPHPGSLGRMYNAAAQEARGDFLLLVHDDIECLHDGWLEELIAQCQRPGVAVAGPRLLDGDGNLVEAGIIPVQAGLLAPPFSGQAADKRETIPRPHIVRQVSAVSSACLMIRRDVWISLDGMNSPAFSQQQADIDLCLRARQRGGKIVWTPFSTLLHDSDRSTSGDRLSNKALLAHWEQALVDDPWFSPAMALDASHYEAEDEPAFLPDLIPGTPCPRIYCVVSGAPARAQRRLLAPVETATRLGHILGRVGPFFPLPILLRRLRTDIFICPSLLDERQRRDLADYRRLAGCTIVMDLDDRLADPAITTNAGQHMLKDIESLSQLVERFITSSPLLAAELGAHATLGGRIRLLPESLNLADWPFTGASPRSERQKPRVGWFGQPDGLEMIAAAIVDLADTVDWIFLGTPPDMLLSCAAERHQAVNQEELPRKLASLNLDFAILPQAPTAFNEYGSSLQALQYGALGIPVLVSPRYPFLGENPFPRLPNDRNQTWIEAIRHWAGNPDIVRQHALTMRQYVVEHCDLGSELSAWLAAWDIKK